VLKGSQMSKVHLSAGQPGVARCSAATTGNNPTRARRRGEPVTHQHAGLSFWTVTKTARGAVVCDRPFDVPAQGFAGGCVTGLRVFLEFMRALRASEVSRFDTGRVMEAAFEAAKEPEVQASRYGAAYAFLGAIARPLQAAAEWFEFDSIIHGEIEAIEQHEAKHQQHLGEKRAAFVLRMKAARQAKAAGAGAPSQVGHSSGIALAGNLYPALDPSGVRVLLPVGQCFDSQGVLGQCEGGAS